MTEDNSHKGQVGHREPGQGSNLGRIDDLHADYANLMGGLLVVYQTAFESHWFAAAQELAGITFRSARRC